MTYTPAHAVILVSLFKPILMIAVLLVWGRWATYLDKEAEYFYLPRLKLNLLQLGAAVTAFALWLLIPIFWLGLPLALAILVAAGIAFAVMRNAKVSDHEKWELSLDFFREMLLARRQAAAAKDAKLRFVSKGVFAEVPGPSDPQYAGHMTMEQVLVPAFERNAQRVAVQIADKQTAVQYEIDVVPYKQDSPTPQQALAMIQYLQAQAGMNSEDLRRKQIGQCRIEAGQIGGHNLQITTSGSTRSLQMLIDFDVDDRLKIDLEDSGLLPSQIEQLQPVFENEERVVLVASPSRNGRTTTLYALLRQHDPYLLDIHTIEKRVELPINGVSQHELEDRPMAKTLHSLFLRDPKVVMVSHIADQDTPKVIAEAALDRKRVYVGIPGGDTMAALRAWAKSLGDLKHAGDSLAAIISPRLIRKLCPACKQAYQPDAAALKKLNLPADRIRQLYKASGTISVDNKPQPCEMCHGLGYHGLTGVFEVMIIDDQAREHLAQDALVPLRNHLRKNKMLLHQEVALAKVVEGQTSISEVMRVLSGTGGAKS